MCAAFLHLFPVVCLQKYSQQRELQRQLRRFIVTGADFHALLLHLLRELVREERNNMRLLGNMEDEIIVPCRCVLTERMWVRCLVAECC